MKYLNTLTSQYTPSELYKLITDTIEGSGSGGDAILTNSGDVFSIQKDGSIFLEVIKKVDGERLIVSKKRLKMYEAYQLFELFENVYDNHLMRKEN